MNIPDLVKLYCERHKLPPLTARTCCDHSPEKRFAMIEFNDLCNEHRILCAKIGLRPVLYCRIVLTDCGNRDETLICCHFVPNISYDFVCAIESITGKHRDDVCYGSGIEHAMFYFRDTAEGIAEMKAESQITYLPMPEAAENVL